MYVPVALPGFEDAVQLTDAEPVDPSPPLTAVAVTLVGAVGSLPLDPG